MNRTEPLSVVRPAACPGFAVDHRPFGEQRGRRFSQGQGRPHGEGLRLPAAIGRRGGRRDEDGAVNVRPALR